MRFLALFLSFVIVLGSLATAWMRNGSNAVAARNEQTEREIARLVRSRDLVRADVLVERQPLAVRARLQGIDGDGGLLLASAPPTKRSSRVSPKTAPTIERASARKTTPPSRSVKGSSAKGAATRSGSKKGARR